MSAQHTPGPWSVASKPSSVVGWPVCAELGTEVAYVQTLVFAGQPIPKEAQANARLIAAAPELLEALEAVSAEYRRLNPMRTADVHKMGCKCIRCAIDFADAAIAKARGQA